MNEIANAQGLDPSLQSMLKMLCMQQHLQQQRHDEFMQHMRQERNTTNTLAESFNTWTQGQTTATGGSRGGPAIRVEKFPLPEFHGNVLDWPQFWQAFRVAVDENPDIHPVNKCGELFRLCRGDAARALRGLPQTEECYYYAIQILKDRFEDFDRVETTLLQKLFDVSFHDPNPSRMRSAFDSYQGTIRTLAALGADLSKLEYPIKRIVSTVESSTRIELERAKRLQYPNEEWGVLVFEELMREHLRLQEKCIPMDRPAPVFQSTRDIEWGSTGRESDRVRGGFSEGYGGAGAHTLSPEGASSPPPQHLSQSPHPQPNLSPRGFNGRPGRRHSTTELLMVDPQLEQQRDEAGSSDDDHSSEAEFSPNSDRRPQSVDKRPPSQKSSKAQANNATRVSRAAKQSKSETKVFEAMFVATERKVNAKPKPPNPKHSRNQAKRRTPSTPCVFCGKTGHWHSDCQTVKTLEDRIKHIGGRCSVCLKAHNRRGCSRRNKPCLFCNGDHHPALCRTKAEKALKASLGNEEDSSPSRKKGSGGKARRERKRRRSDQSNTIGQKQKGPSESEKNGDKSTKEQRDQSNGDRHRTQGTQTPEAIGSVADVQLEATESKSPCNECPQCGQTQPSSESNPPRSQPKDQALHDGFWEDFSKHYLSLLRIQSGFDPSAKTRTEMEPTVNQTVLLKPRKDAKHGHWKLARVLDLLRREDGRVSRVTLKVCGAKRPIERPLQALCPLEAMNVSPSAEDSASQ